MNFGIATMNLAVANKPLLPAKPGESDNASSLLGDSNQATLPSCRRETRTTVFGRTT